MKFTRDFYIPSDEHTDNGVTKVEDSETNAVAYTYEMNGKPYALCFGGRRQKPDFHYWYRSTETRDKAVAGHFETAKRAKEYKNERKAVRAASTRKLEVGDILSSSWGYDQTNVDFYQVVGLVGNKSVSIRKIAAADATDQDGFDGYGDRGMCVPSKDHFIGEAMTKRVGETGMSVKITSYSSAIKVSPDKKHYWSSYA